MNDTDASDRESAYECFECGTIHRSASQPIHCPDCGGQMRNRETALE
ncbi:rubrerythrin-like domain-containing protein [Halolamina litorea]|uniref:Rubrerythrin-like domain-containing protein n=1 Tax=Halolamina litorea TaxID=1515593 RepID=A0ABD6BTS0_9EURY|nr:rubrerythrin-like domain-containing protein [Halolamina litorea]